MGVRLLIVFPARVKRIFIPVIFIASILFAPSLVSANPESGQVVAGQASISNPQPSITQINQASDKAIIEWQSFNVAAQEKVHFQQPTGGVCLNRINAKHGASEILGQVTATGTVALVNQAGIIFGPNAQVNVGSLAASTADIANENFMQGKYKFDQPSAYNGKVINHGKISAKDNGLIALIGSKVINDGMIQAKSGKVVLASGKNVTLDFCGDGLISFSVPDVELNDGVVLVSTDSLNTVLDGVINTNGFAKATTVQSEDGKVIFSGGNIDVSGENGGGTVLINAKNTAVTKEATINADARSSGDGGKIIIYADKSNFFEGSVSAHGGKNSGKGGFLEVSGKENLHYDAHIDLTATQGTVGTLLLDPQFLVVATAGGSAYSAGVNNLFANNSGGTNTLTPASIVAAFVGANVVLQANTDVTFTDVLTSGTAGRTLTVNAGRSILVNANVSTVNGAISMTANDPTAISADRLSGVGNISVAPGVAISSGTGSLSLIVDPSVVAPFSPGDITLGALTGGAVSLSTPNAVTGVDNIAASAGLTVNVGTASSLTTGVISGTTLTKQGVGTLTLGGVNTYTALTTVSAGTLKITNNSGLGTTGAGVTVVSGATLDLDNVTIGAEAVTLNGDGVSGVGALTGTGTSSLSGAITLASSSTIGGAGTLTLSGIISDSTSTFNLTKTGAGTVILSAANTYDGATNINQGILRAGIAGAIASTNMLSLANVAGASFDLNGLAQTVGNLSGGGSLGGNISLGAATLTVTQSMSGTYSGIISGTGGLTKNGAGELALGGINLYTGATTINAGTLMPTVSNAIANSTALTMANVDGAILDMSGTNQTIGSLSGGGTTGGNITIGSGTLTINQAATLTYTGIMSGTGGIVKNGAGTLSLAGLNTYSGPTTINLGILAPTVANAIQFTSALTLADVATATFQMNTTNQTVGSLSGGGASGGNITLGSGILTINQTVDGTYDGIKSTGGITKIGPATLTITRPQTYTGATTINAGTLKAGVTNVLNVASTLTLANVAGAIFDLNNFSQSIARLSGGGPLGGNITLGSATLTVNQGATATYNGIISGTGGLTKAGASILNLGGMNTYTGPTAITAGTLQAVADNVIQNSSALTMTNLATAIFSVNGTTQNIGTLSGGGVLGGNITLGIGVLTINQSALGSYDGIISGIGDVTKAGTGTLILTRASTYTGATVINAGILQAGIANVIGGSNGLSFANVAGASFDLITFNQTAINLSGGGALGGNINLGSATLSVTQNMPGTYSGVIAGTGGFTKTGSSVLTLGDVSTYTGTTTISAGTLRPTVNNAIANSGALTMANTDGAIFDLNNTNQTVGTLSGGGTTGGNIILGSGTLTVNQGASLTYAGLISGTGGLIKAGTGTLSLSRENTYSGATTINLGILKPTIANAIANTSSLIMADVATAAFNATNLAQSVGTLSGGGAAGGNISLGSGLLTVTQSTDQTYDGVISGTGGLTKNGAATLLLSRANTYSGTTTINAGILRAGIANAIASSAQMTLANVAGASFDLNNLAQTVGRLSGGGATGGNITIGSADLTVNQATSGTTYSGIISGTGGLIKTGAAALSLGGINTYSGTTTISAGTLQAIVNNVIQNSSALIMANVATAIFNQNGTSQIIGSLSGGGATGGNISLGVGTLTITQNAAGTYDGVISGPGNIIKIGTDTLTLTRNNTFTGNTAVNAGVLSISADLQLGAAPGAATTNKLTFDGGTLRTTASFTLNANRGITLNASGGTILVDPTFTLTYNGIAAGTGTLTKSDTGTLSLGGVSTYTGATIINAGTITTTVANAIANTSALTLANVSGAIFNLNNTNQTVGTVSGGGSSGGDITLGSGTLTVNQTAAGNLAGLITGTGGLTLSSSSSNVLTLNNASNSYSGNTTLNGGTLSISADDNLGTAPGVATPGKLAFNGGTLKNSASFTLDANRGIALNASGGTIEVDTGATVTYNGIMAGAGAFTKTGAGTLILGGLNTYTDNTAINAGIVSLTNSTGLSATTNISVASGGTLDLNFNAATFANTNPINLNGSNALTLSGANITVNNPLTINSAATISGTGTGVMTFGGVITGAANLTFSLTNAGISLPNTTLTGSASLTVAANGAITQTGVLTIPGAASFSAGANPITLTSNNNFTGAVAVNNSGANDVSIISSGALALGTSTVGRGLNITAGGSITQTGPLTAPNGTTTLAVTAANSDILLNQANNLGSAATVFSGILANIRDVALRNTSTSAVTPILSGLVNLRNLALTFNAGNIILSNLIASGQVTLIGNSADGSLNVGALSLGTNFANLTGFVAGLSGQAAIDIITLLNIITSGTHYFDGIDMFLGTRAFNNVIQSVYGMLYEDWGTPNLYVMQQLEQQKRCRIVGDKVVLCNPPTNG